MLKVAKKRFGKKTIIHRQHRGTKSVKASTSTTVTYTTVAEVHQSAQKRVNNRHNFV